MSGAGLFTPIRWWSSNRTCIGTVYVNGKYVSFRDTHTLPNESKLGSPGRVGQGRSAQSGRNSDRGSSRPGNILFWWDILGHFATPHSGAGSGLTPFFWTDILRHFATPAPVPGPCAAPAIP